MADAKIGGATVVKQAGHEFVLSISGLMGAPGNEFLDVHGVGVRHYGDRQHLCQRRGVALLGRCVHSRPR
ncbi:hypothetical protein MUBE_08295 [Mycobacterium uberis]|uniref:Uncharacterized protein n=1 Tax=Mycobacterium uberis TaxID=2162698 RepID=A0A3E1HGG4_9MYCO|nr:hypothetical protein MUBE_08295 [Mycobacterium uberis]